ncbi:MAG: M3 family metallopeptidase [Cyclobacteriaceae bacterium]|nr:M3 family metallopeptidase [Cyclobacteriaceae bacterium]MCH8517289.1 M3 family metallopeptidase [Cyclobacteriaceae bacterium]
MSNILLESFKGDYNAAPFNKIQLEDYKPAIETLIAETREKIDAIKNQAEAPSFENTVVAMEEVSRQLNIVSGIFFNLNAAETNDKMQELARLISPMLTAFSNDIYLDDVLFQRIAKVYESTENYDLDAEDKMLLKNSYLTFIQNGANLDEEEKKKLREFDKELSDLSLQFGENALAEVNKYELVIEDEEKLSGIPESIREMAAETAEEKDKKGKWVFTLEYPSYVPFMTYCEDRELRKEMYLASSTKNLKGDDLDNQEIIKRIIRLRYDRAKLLGYDNHAHYTLEDRMAESPERVNAFIEDLTEKSLQRGKEDVAELQAYARKKGLNDELMAWDFAFYSEQLKKEKYEVDKELLKPYFPLDNCVEGIFKVAKRLFGLQFELTHLAEVYHPDVKVYDVKDEEGKHVGLFYTDFFPRAGKRSGAWMTVYRNQAIMQGEEERPHISIVCNFSKPTKSRPSLLTFDEVTTLFHEFGHALHGLLAKGKYSSLAGTNVYWDFVELPSQIMENWCFEKEALDLFAAHYETKDKIPAELVERIKNSSRFMSGYMMMRQLSFAKLDMAYHTVEPDEVHDVIEFESKQLASTQLLPRVKGTGMSGSFGHIFQGGYAAGYYSYKWAEVLDADAYELFKEKGIFDKETAKAFQQHILEKGGSEHPMELYKQFRGREPETEAILRRDGLIEA